MRIGIIGAGKLGSTLAHLLVDAGHDVGIANSRGPDTLDGLEKDLGAHGHAMTADDAARYGDVVVAAIPFGRYRDLPAEALAGKTVIDTSNYHRERDGSVPELDDTRNTTSSELVQHRLRDARIVKAFNAMPWDRLRDYGDGNHAGNRYGIPVSGDDPAAKKQVFDVIEQLGFEPVDAGTLAEGGRKHQPGTDVYTAALSGEDLRVRVGVAAGVKGESTMAAHAGEKAQKTGDFHCAKCDEKVHVQQGHTIPKCPNGHSEFETRTNEPGNKSS